jgi:hypothetical protein
MEQQEIDLGDAELAQAIVYRTLKVTVCDVVGCYFGGDEDLIARYVGSCQAFTNEFLVCIALGSVDMSVAGKQSRLHDAGTVLAPQLPRAETNYRDGGGSIVPAEIAGPSFQPLHDLVRKQGIGMRCNCVQIANE